MSTQPTQPEALRLADWLQAAVQIYPQRSEDDPGGYASEVDQVMDEAAAELRRLHALTQSTPATGGEPVACNCKATDMRLGVCCKVRAAFEEWYDQQQDGRIQPFDVWLAAWKGGRKSVGTSPQPVREPLSTIDLMRVVMKADEESQDTRGTTNWAAHIGKAAQAAVLAGGAQPVREPLSDEMVTAGARVLNQRLADECNINKDDQWAIYADDFKEEARAVLLAAHGITGGQHGTD